MPFPMMRLRTDDIPRRERMAFVHDFVARHVAGLQFCPAERDNISINLEAMMLPRELTIGRARYTPMHGARTRYLLQDGRQHYLLTVHTEDHEISVGGKEPIKIAAGDVMLVNEGICTEFWLGKPTSVDVVSLNRQVLDTLVPRIGLEASYVLPFDADVLPLLRSYVRTLRRNPPGSVKAAETASRHIYDLAAQMLDNQVRGGANWDGDSIAAARLKLVQQDILERLSDPALNIDAVAGRQRVTARYIQRLFEKSGTSFTDFVREHRLDLAFRILRNRTSAGKTIAAIAYDCGFSDVSSFNRAFRQRFDATPSDVKAAALTA
ncbi:helix-turn-helix transcriptional regulator [Methylocystis echinoides]|uniref:AraC family transcriptional regulator n=1 Tax=Methylocystis echinoides TaxID=29468 RepID=A0A9W6LT16_9HYPH|nr:AraC family transcriptional regulator [Methylocystis echinoides]GLI94265.1 AraC family transcriptional regulator [Methylocystis echinoides]